MLPLVGAINSWRVETSTHLFGFIIDEYPMDPLNPSMALLRK